MEWLLIFGTLSGALCVGRICANCVDARLFDKESWSGQLNFGTRGGERRSQRPLTTLFAVQMRWVPSFFKFKKVDVKTNTADSKNLSATFSEHTWDLHRIIENHPCSRIYSADIARSVGLSQDDAKRLLELHGMNALPKAKEISDCALFIKQFLNLLWVLLIIASTLSLIGYLANTSQLSNLWVTIAMYSMIFIMCTISFWQERTARRTVRGFANLLPDVCTVIRDGEEQAIPVPNLTIGDIIIIKSGNRVPADCRILKCTEFKLETSSITGEPEPLEYQAEAVSDDISVFEGRNIAFNGSLCVDGFAYAVVIKVGINTIIGQIANMTTGQKEKGSHLEKEISRFVKFLVVASTTTGLTCFVVGGFIHKWRNVVSLLANGFLVSAIGMVPCGLPASVTSILTLISRRMAKNNVYLKRLDVVEALGAVSIIASDKTGTLTKNLMTVTDIWHLDTKITGLPEQKNSTLSKREGVKAYSQVLERLLTTLSVCNAAKFLEPAEKADKMDQNGLDVNGNTPRPTSGSPSEVAMINYCDRIFDIEELRSNHNLIFEIPFNSKRKWHLQIHLEKVLNNGKSVFRLMMKGAPEILIKKCSSINSDDGPVPLEEEQLKTFQRAYDSFGDEGKRVIGSAELLFEAPSGTAFKADEENFPTSGLTFCGMCAIMDPPRDETARAVEACKGAGIKVFMVTGDHPSTAAAIAVQIGLITEEQKRSCVIHGERIPLLSEEDWNSILFNDYLVFARTTPEQKLMIVEQCQKRGQSIAMTGDGVNDAPALKKANVGVAMGSGSEVAKQAADIILMDDNFSSIVKAIEQGRLMFDNIKKLLGYTMPHNFPEVYPVLLYYILGMPQGITALQILSIDLGTELLPGIAMSNEPIENNVMKQPPRRKDKKLVSNTLLAYGYGYEGQLQSICCIISYLYVFWSHGINSTDLLYSQDSWYDGGKDFVSRGRTYTWPEQQEILRKACSAWHIGIVFAQFWHVWAARTRKESIFVHGVFRNKVTLIGVVLEIGLLCLYVYTPGLNTWLGGSPPPPECWAIVAAFGIFILSYNEFRKFCIRRWPRNRIVRVFKW